MKNSLKFKRGFTLAEILIVIAIIGILASIALIGLGGSRVKARDAKRIAEVRQIQSGLELYFNRCGFYPGPTDCTGGFAAQPAPSWAQVNLALEAGLGITTIPDEDPSGVDYLYSAKSDGLSYILGAKLEADNLVLRSDTDVFPAGFAPVIDCTDLAAAPGPYNYCVQF